MSPSFTIDRDIPICAPLDLVARYLTDSTRWARWWGAGSTIDPRPGGDVVICYPNGQTARGEVIALEPPSRLVFTFGYDRPGAPIPPGGSRVTIALRDAPAGTVVALRHEVDTAATRDEHRAGWRYQLAVLADVVGREHADGLTATLDRYLAAWAERDPAARAAALAATCAEDVVYRDRYGYARGRDDLALHIAAAQLHLPARLERDGEPAAAHGMAIVGWRAHRTDGAVAARGRLVVELARDGRIARLTAFWLD